MIILAGAVAGAGPMRNNFQAVQRAIAPETFETASDETIISAYYASYAEVMYSGYADKTPYAKRAAKDEKLALESLAIRKEMENGSSLEEASQKVTGKRACEEDEYPSASVRLGQASRPAYLNEYTGAVSTESADKAIANVMSKVIAAVSRHVFSVIFSVFCLIPPARLRKNHTMHWQTALLCWFASALPSGSALRLCSLFPPWSKRIRVFWLKQF